LSILSSTMSPLCKVITTPVAACKMPPYVSNKL
jgi:hypothetical protein